MSSPSGSSTRVRVSGLWPVLILADCVRRCRDPGARTGANRSDGCGDGPAARVLVPHVPNGPVFEREHHNSDDLERTPAGARGLRQRDDPPCGVPSCSFTDNGPRGSKRREDGFGDRGPVVSRDCEKSPSLHDCPRSVYRILLHGLRGSDRRRRSTAAQHGQRQPGPDNDGCAFTSDPDGMAPERPRSYLRAPRSRAARIVGQTKAPVAGQN